VNPFWKSKKFVYALATFLAALVVSILPLFSSDMNQETVDMLQQMLPLIFAVGLLIITGHTVTDVMYIWKEGLTFKNLKDATHELVEAIPLPEQVTGKTTLPAIQPPPPDYPFPGYDVSGGSGAGS